MAHTIPASVIPDSKTAFKAAVAAVQAKIGQPRKLQRGTLGKVEVPITSIEQYVPDKPGVTTVKVYDITVEGAHKYLASHLLVSNSKRIGTLDVHSLISHGATEFLKDAKLIRGQRNDTYWRAIRAGETPLEPSGSFASDHFRNLLRAAGVQFRSAGTRTSLAPMLDRDVDQFAHHEITSPETFDKNMRPIPGGLFDPKATGGADGRQWGVITLPRPIPHPLFEVPIIKMLGITRKTLEGVLAGTEKLDGQTGPEAIHQALSNLDLPREQARLRGVVAAGAGSKRDDAVKALGYLKGLETSGVKPQDLMITRIPVLPPKFRPITRTPKLDITHDLNYLYQDLLEAKQNYRDMHEASGQSGDQLLTMYRAARAVSSMGDPVGEKSAQQGVKGALAFALGKGDDPKGSVFQRRVMGNAVDSVGRGVITAAPELDMDQIRIPREMAWNLYRPFAIRELVRNGKSAQESVKEIQARTPVALATLRKVMGDRPVVYNRAPSLHRYSYAAGHPVLGPEGDDSIGINYVVEKGLASDHDGNCIIGSSQILLELMATGNTFQERAEHAAQEYAMSLSSTKLISMSPGGVIAQIAIRDMPHLPETRTVDKNGADVFQVPAGVKILTVGENGSKVQWAPVTSFTVESGCSLRKVTTSRGKEVTCSSNESLAVYRDGGLVRVKPDEAIGELVATVKRLATRGTKYTWAHGWVIGAFLSDGWVNVSQIGYTKVSQGHRDRFVKCLGEITGGEVNYTTYRSMHVAALNGGIGGESTKIHVPFSNEDSKLGQLARYMRTLFVASSTPKVDARSCLRKKLPDDLFEYSEEALLGLLAGLMDGDGSVVVCVGKAKPQATVAFATSSPYLRDGVKLLCRLLGIRTSHSSTQPSAKRVQVVESFQVAISSPDFGQHLGGLNLMPGAGRDLLQETWRDMLDQIDIIPVDAKLLTESVRELRRGAHQNLKRATQFMNTVNKLAKQTGGRTGSMTRQSIIAAFVECPALKAMMPDCARLVEDRDVNWERITTVEEVPTEVVYDVGVPDTKVFALENGLVVYDTINIHLPASDKAAREALEKMLPSKNLLAPGTGESHFEPQQDYVVGLHLASQVHDRKPPRVFATADQALKAYAQGEISLSDPIRVVEH